MPKTNNTFRVLDLLSQNPKNLERLLPRQVGDVSIQVVGGIIKDPYNFDVNEKQQIEGITSSNEIDYVVVGNNMGWGVPRAYAINQRMRDRTCIVWIIYRGRTHQQYSVAGFDTFLSRHELNGHITRYIQRNPVG